MYIATASSQPVKFVTVTLPVSTSFSSSIPSVKQNIVEMAFNGSGVCYFPICVV
ncbi:MAG: IS1-like element transposase [Plesiomonas sp.]|uniref:IS1-like element transposase n=1 Tax=Plesiomonas sp. TaxID=2486279 RepID=UPI003F39F9FE